MPAAPVKLYVTPQPIGDQTPEEIDQLQAEVNYLAAHEAAVPRKWSSDLFQEWRKPHLAAAIAAGVNRDPYMDTRLTLAEQFDSKDVHAVPVYGGQQQFTESQPTSEQAQQTALVEQALTIEVMQRLPVPDYDTPLESLIRLRQNPAFRTALDDLLEWKPGEVPTIVLAPDRARAITIATRHFRQAH